MIAAPVMGFDIEKMRKMESFAIALFDSRSMAPWASRCAIRPLRATSVTAPEIWCASMWRWMVSWMRVRRSLERPTSSGLVC